MPHTVIDWLWGYLKETVDVNQPQTPRELKNNIQQEIRASELETFGSDREHNLERAQPLEAENRGHLCDVIFHGYLRVISLSQK